MSTSSKFIESDLFELRGSVHMCSTCGGLDFPRGTAPSAQKRITCESEDKSVRQKLSGFRHLILLPGVAGGAPRLAQSCNSSSPCRQNNSPSSLPPVKNTAVSIRIKREDQDEPSLQSTHSTSLFAQNLLYDKDRCFQIKTLFEKS